MFYRNSLSKDVNENFALFVGSKPAPSTSSFDVEATVKFFVDNFADSVFNPDDEDDVIEFCQMGPAGNYGRPNSVESMASKFPGYTDAIEDAINAAWELDGI